MNNVCYIFKSSATLTTTLADSALWMPGYYFQKPNEVRVANKYDSTMKWQTTKFIHWISYMYYSMQAAMYKTLKYVNSIIYPRINDTGKLLFITEKYKC